MSSAPQLVGQDARRVTQLWEEMYNGTRGHYALSRGRTFPALGRRGLNVAAMSGVDMALWDLLGKSLGAPVVDLWGGACRADMPLVRQWRLGGHRWNRSRTERLRRAWLLGRQDARRGDGRRRRYQHLQGRGGTLRARAGHRPDGRRPRYVQAVRGEALRGGRRTIRREVVRRARECRRSPRRSGCSLLDQHRDRGRRE